MQRLTLILSDLYLPEETDKQMALPQTIGLPSLDWLLRFAASSQHIGDWRRWLADELALLTPMGLSLAHYCAMRLLQASAPAAAWLATPVQLEARLDHVRLVDRGLLRMDAGERAACRAEFARVFGPQYALHDAGARGFLLTGLADTVVSTRDPARLLDADIAAALPAGAEAAQLRRLGAEIEMWLHESELNAAREQSRRRRISALWLWDGGIAAEPGVPAPRTARIGSQGSLHLLGSDPFILGLAHEPASQASHWQHREVANANLRDVRDAAHAVVELTPMTGPAEESLAALEERWFAPARAALAQGTLAACDVIANDRWFRIGARPAWKFWRRPVNWFDRLAAA